jgi:peptidyl-prolyl cis-trans isomerase SurA
MKRCYLLTIALVLNVTFAFSQKKEVLLTIDNKPVYVSEFKRVYQKNLDLVKDESQKSVDGYLDLFIDYKLKIAEAYDQKLDERSTYKEEFNKYQEQLSRSYIYDSSLSEELVKEAYDRGLEEIEARHILILSKYEDAPQDTLVAYNKIKEIRQKALQGEDFEMLAKKYSEEPGASERGGYLGYFSAFGMVYPFESMAYNTAVGEVSEIVRTQFGYHIIKVLNKRKKGPEITVSHIMILDKPEDSTGFKPNERIREIAKLLEQGESFEKLAKQFSDDKNSGVRGGLLNKFSRGSLRSKIFENYAFNLKTPGELSKPFQSEFGWHIIKLNQIHEVPDFEAQREQLERRVREGDRSKVVTSAISNKIKSKYGFKAGQPYFDYFMEYLPESVLKRRFFVDSVAPVKKELLFRIGDRDVMFEDFARYIEDRHKRVRPYREKELLLTDLYDEFEINELKDYFRYRLEMENEDYAATINEYRSGLLIFDLMNANIWQKAKTDTTGLENFYNKTRDNYLSGERVNAILVSATSQEFAEKARIMLQKDMTAEAIRDSLNSKKEVNVIVTATKFDADSPQLPKGFVKKTGVSEIYNNEGSFVVMNIKELIPPGPKAFEEVRGRVLNNYQNYLESEWMKNLRNKFKVEVNKKVLKKVIKELKA